VSRTTFDKLVRLLARNPIFRSRGRKPQRAVRYQLAAFLLRFGKRGADVMSTAKELGIGTGTVLLYCRHVTRALRELGIRVIQWGSAARQQEIANWIEEQIGIPNCCGIVDGSLIRLTELPWFHGIVFLCRKKYPAVRKLHLLKCNYLMTIFFIGKCASNCRPSKTFQALRNGVSRLCG
jgi:hypothetical protein